MVVADSGPLIALARLDLLRLLRSQFDSVLVPEVVMKECTAETQRPGAQTILAARDAGVIEAMAVADAERFAMTHLLDPGEAAALLLGKSALARSWWTKEGGGVLLNAWAFRWSARWASCSPHARQDSCLLLHPCWTRSWHSVIACRLS